MTNVSPGTTGRRQFLQKAVASAGVVLAGCAALPAGEEAGSEAEVTPGEDLMQEHGVLERVLLIYEEAGRRLDRSSASDNTVVLGAAGIVRGFVEDYHERLEERYVFPRLESAHLEVQLVATLRAQHVKGRQLTDEITRLCAGSFGDTEALRQALSSFIRMYRPHAAREETALLPAFRSLLGGAEYRELGERFEDEEHARFGKRGFEETVNEVARLEQSLEIADLASFTPQ